MNMKIIEQGYNVKSYLKLVLNKLKVLVGPTLFIPLWGPNSKKLPWGFHVCID